MALNTTRKCAWTILDPWDQRAACSGCVWAFGSQAYAWWCPGIQLSIQSLLVGIGELIVVMIWDTSKIAMVASVKRLASNVFSPVCAADACDDMTICDTCVCIFQGHFGGWFEQISTADVTFHNFCAEAMIGGVIWCSGNCLTVYIIRQIGLGPGHYVINCHHESHHLVFFFMFFFNSIDIYVAMVTDCRFSDLDRHVQGERIILIYIEHWFGIDCPWGQGFGWLPFSSANEISNGHGWLWLEVHAERKLEQLSQASYFKTIQTIHFYLYHVVAAGFWHGTTGS